MCRRCVGAPIRLLKAGSDKQNKTFKKSNGLREPPGVVFGIGFARKK